jgi:hypothetical protein
VILDLRFTITLVKRSPGFQVRGAHLKKLRRAEGGAKIFEVFRVKNHIFSNFRGGARRVRPPPGSAPVLQTDIIGNISLNIENTDIFGKFKEEEALHLITLFLFPEIIYIVLHYLIYTVCGQKYWRM